MCNETKEGDVWSPAIAELMEMADFSNLDMSLSLRAARLEAAINCTAAKSYRLVVGSSGHG